MPNDPQKTGELFLSTAQVSALTDFLNAEDSAAKVEGWLVEQWQVSPLKAKLITKALYPALRALLSGFAERGINRLHDFLCKKSAGYDAWIQKFCAWLCYRMDERRAMDAATQRPPHVSEEQWRVFSEDTKGWLTEFEKLDFISATLEGLNAQVKLEIDAPRKLSLDSLSQLLRPHNAFIDLIGRGTEMARLRDVCNSSELLRWQVIAADGGLGKTRLAIEFAKQQVRAGWDAGFLRTQPLRALVGHDQFGDWSPVVDTLIVVDYALGTRKEVETLLERCVRYARDGAGEPNAPRIRLLLLERHGDEEAGWVQELKTFVEGALRDDIAEACAGVLQLRPPQRGLDNDDALREVLRATFDAWRKLGGQASALPDLSADDLQRLRANTEGRPLYLQMAALRACVSGESSALTHWSLEDLLLDAVKRERELLEPISKLLSW